MRCLAALIVSIFLSAQPSAAAVLNFVLEKSGGNGFSVSEELEGSQFGFSLFGNSSASGAPTWTRYTAIAPDLGGRPLHVTGHWSYVSQDMRGAWADAFGYLLNGMKTELFDAAGPRSQAGEFSFYLSSGDQLSWYVDSVDGLGARATVGVTADLAPVPLPAASLLMLGAVVTLGAARHRRSRG